MQFKQVKLLAQLFLLQRICCIHIGMIYVHTYVLCTSIFCIIIIVRMCYEYIRNLRTHIHSTNIRAVYWEIFEVRIAVFADLLAASKF